MRVDLVDPAAYTPPYDHALAGALARAGVDVELITSAFVHGEVPREPGYAVREAFYPWSPRDPRVRRAARLAQHVPGMLAYRRGRARRADVVHWQWLALQQLDAALLPRGRPQVLTAHDVLPREASPGQHAGQRRLYAQMDAVVVHSDHGAARLRDEARVDPARVRVIPHGAFTGLTRQPESAALPPELGDVGRARGAGRGERPVVLCFGLMRPYKGIDRLLAAWRALGEGVDAELWIVGAPRMDLAALRAMAPASVRWVPRFVTGAELAATFRAADLCVLPYREIDQSGVLFTALAFGVALLLTDVGGFGELAPTGAASIVAPGDGDALAAELGALIEAPARREAMAAAALAAAAPDGAYGWDAIARQHAALYAELA